MYSFPSLYSIEALYAWSGFGEKSNLNKTLEQ